MTAGDTWAFQAWPEADLPTSPPGRKATLTSLSRWTRSLLEPRPAPGLASRPPWVLSAAFRFPLSRRPFTCRRYAMAKPASIKIRLNSTADTGFFYVTKKNARTKTEKLELKKYDPVVRKHVDVPRRQDQIRLR